MADIIPLDEKLDQAQNRRNQRLAEHKRRTVESVLRQVRHDGACEKCGAAVDSRIETPAEVKRQTPYRLCAPCADEYADFIDRIQGGGDSRRYWQNATWRESWKRWIDYQGSLHSFMASKEFRRLVQEVRSPDTTN